MEVANHRRLADVRHPVLYAPDGVAHLLGRHDAEGVREADGVRARADGPLVDLAEEGQLRVARVLRAEADDVEGAASVLDGVRDDFY